MIGLVAQAAEGSNIWIPVMVALITTIGAVVIGLVPLYKKVNNQSSNLNIQSDKVDAQTEKINATTDTKNGMLLGETVYHISKNLREVNQKLDHIKQDQKNIHTMIDENVLKADIIHEQIMARMFEHALLAHHEPTRVDKKGVSKMEDEDDDDDV